MALKSDPSTWSDPRHRRGFEGEEVAKAYLRSQGWMVVDHRFRLGRLEIARRGSLVIFVEVKTRRGTAFGSPLEAITWTKKREIARVARGWVERHGRSEDAYRFDVIGVTTSRSGEAEIEHVADAFRPGWR